VLGAVNAGELSARRVIGEGFGEHPDVGINLGDASLLGFGQCIPPGGATLKVPGGDPERSHVSGTWALHFAPPASEMTLNPMN